ncbi:unnamed protein product [Rangifer tarandus platyrhynchus]|uniref:Uncharacterized protein n=2 Tax=Rangifer tarandus platyrhynchus TaxID=3082113 RepID=A0ACB1MJ84_RANTA|nr:unnamed protein product [Rangifer tarandus platyrhynchus]
MKGTWRWVQDSAEMVKEQVVDMIIKPAHRARLVAPAPGRETEEAVSPSRCSFSSTTEGPERQGGWGVFQSGLKRFLWQMFRQRALTYLIAASQVFPWASLVAQTLKLQVSPPGSTTWVEESIPHRPGGRRVDHTKGPH